MRTNIAFIFFVLFTLPAIANENGQCFENLICTGNGGEKVQVKDGTLTVTNQNGKILLDHSLADTQCSFYRMSDAENWTCGGFMRALKNNRNPNVLFSIMTKVEDDPRDCNDQIDTKRLHYGKIRLNSPILGRMIMFTSCQID
jgi:hypothetical protein